MLELVKLALRITDDDFDDELNMWISAAVKDLGFAGITTVDQADDFTKGAIITYVKIHFGQPDDIDKLRQMYENFKEQMSTATGYTTWEISTDGQI